VGERSSQDIAVIVPARGGSKRIPHKNVRPFQGVPIIVRVVRLLKATPQVGRIVVSTDDPEIAALVSDECELISRPLELADDYTPTWPVIVHAINKVELRSDQIVACVYPTAVLLRPEGFAEAIAISQRHPGRYVFPAVKFGYPPQRAFRIDAEGASKMFEPELYFARSQDLDPVYHDAGQYYLATAHTWLSQDRFYDVGIPLVISELEAQDIDTLSDWALAELKYSLIHRHAFPESHPSP